jgi:hypothetical protein
VTRLGRHSRTYSNWRKDPEQQRVHTVIVRAAEEEWGRDLEIAHLTAVVRHIVTQAAVERGALVCAPEMNYAPMRNLRDGEVELTAQEELVVPLDSCSQMRSVMSVPQKSKEAAEEQEILQVAKEVPMERKNLQGVAEH